MAYMTADDLREWYSVELSSTANFPDPKLEALVAEFEEIAERYRGVAYEPRTTTETMTVATYRLLLQWHKITEITMVNVNGVTVASNVYSLRGDYGIDFNAWQWGTAEVTYTHGFTEPPATILRACREYVLSCALLDRSSIPRDAVSTTEGGYTIRYSTPNWDDGRPTGYLEVDRLLNSVQDYRPRGIA